jgi:hypothetical protein
MGVFPLEGANLGHWFVENTEMKMHFCAPQFLILDEYQATMLDPMRVRGLKFTASTPEKRAYCSLLFGWTYFQTERFLH